MALAKQICRFVYQIREILQFPLIFTAFACPLNREGLSQAALGIGIDEQNLLSVPGKPNSEIGGGGRLAHAALLICDGNDICHVTFTSEDKNRAFHEWDASKNLIIRNELYESMSQQR